MSSLSGETPAVLAEGFIILTSNKSYGDWGAIFSDYVIASATLDKLLRR